MSIPKIQNGSLPVRPAATGQPRPQDVLRPRPRGARGRSASTLDPTPTAIAGRTIARRLERAGAAAAGRGPGVRTGRRDERHAGIVRRRRAVRAAHPTLARDPAPATRRDPAARRPRDRRVPRRARADDHGRRAAGDRHRPRDVDPPPRGVVDHQRLPAGLRRDDAARRAASPTCRARGACSCRRSSCSRSARCSPARRPSLELLIAARLVQAVGGGALVPVATAAASHLFPGAGAAAGARRHRRA